MLTEANIKVVDVDAEDIYGDTASYYFENSRDDEFFGERAPVEEERAAFEALLESVRAGFICEDWDGGGSDDEDSDDKNSQYESGDEERLDGGVPENEQPHTSSSQPGMTVAMGNVSLVDSLGYSTAAAAATEVALSAPNLPCGG